VTGRSRALPLSLLPSERTLAARRSLPRSSLRGQRAEGPSQPCSLSPTAAALVASGWKCHGSGVPEKLSGCSAGRLCPGSLLLRRGREVNEPGLWVGRAGAGWPGKSSAEWKMPALMATGFEAVITTTTTRLICSCVPKGLAHALTVLHTKCSWVLIT